VFRGLCSSQAKKYSVSCSIISSTLDKYSDSCLASSYSTDEYCVSYQLSVLILKSEVVFCASVLECS